MTDLDFVNQAFQACTKNAEAHIGAARKLREAGYNNMAFNGAVLALEEVGKAVLIVMSHERSAGDPDFINERWFEDHPKKLFWVLWSTTFGRSANAIQDFQDFPHVASRIHSRRVNAIYVDPKKADLPEQIPDADVDGMISLAEYCLTKERHATFQNVAGKDKSDLEWFLRAAEDPDLGGVIFGKDSFTHLNSLRGDVHEWIKWLQAEVARLEEFNRKLEEEESKRVPPVWDQELTPKWSLKVRLHSLSHSARPKPLAKWNAASRWVKLSAVKDHRELRVQFLAPKQIPMSGLWPAGSAISNCFVLALNIGTRGFFWWYLPPVAERFFEEIRDLEKDQPLSISSPSLSVDWGRHSLGDGELAEVSRVFEYLRRLPKDRWEPYEVYLRALDLVAKNDLHGRFEPMIFGSFYEAFRACALKQGDWDGSSPFIEAAPKILGVFSDRISTIQDELPRHIQLGDAILEGTQIPTLTLKDAIMMKLFVDLYVSRLAHEALGYRLMPPAESQL